jgi:hypothetical protein
LTNIRQIGVKCISCAGNYLNATDIVDESIQSINKDFEDVLRSLAKSLEWNKSKESE